MLPICNLVADQYPLVIFHGDVGTGKTATAECIANRIVSDSRAEDSLLYKLSNRVRGSGKVGEMGTLLTQAFAEVIEAAGKNAGRFSLSTKVTQLQLLARKARATTKIRLQ